MHEHKTGVYIIIYESKILHLLEETYSSKNYFYSKYHVSKYNFYNSHVEEDLQLSQLCS
jgi:hypothetical protein